MDERAMAALLKKVLLVSTLLMLLCLSTRVALAQQGPRDPGAGVDFEQKLGTQLPLDLPFIDENGATVTLGDYFGEKPVVLAMGYYECPMLCSLVREGLLTSLQDVRLNVGSDFAVVNVSIDPTETPMIAGAAKATMVSRYNRPGSEAGWHFLTGPQDSIAQLADAIGFRYYYDAKVDQYAHASGVTLATPQGAVSRYFYGIEYNPSDMRLGLVESSANTIGDAVDQLLLLCYKYDPVTGQYTGLVMTIVRTAFIVFTVAGLLSIYTLFRNNRRTVIPAR
jgi:protein SCO1/2